MASVTWSGLEELKAALRTMPAHLRDEASPIVEETATQAMAEMAVAYSAVTGNLRRGLKKTTVASGSYGVAVQVRSTSPHAWMYENGTQARHTSHGWNRGTMPPGHVVIPAAIRGRTRMYMQLKRMLQDEGFLVTGSAP